MPTREVGPGGPGHALTRTRSARITEAGALPRQRLAAAARYHDPVGLPLRSARFHHWLIRPVFADKAAQTGLSCPEPGHAHVPIPIPRRNPARAYPERPHPVLPSP